MEIFREFRLIKQLFMLSMLSDNIFLVLSSEAYYDILQDQLIFTYWFIKSKT